MMLKQAGILFTVLFVESQYQCSVYLQLFFFFVDKIN